MSILILQVKSHDRGDCNSFVFCVRPHTHAKFPCEVLAFSNMIRSVNSNGQGQGWAINLAWGPLWGPV